MCFFGDMLAANGKRLCEVREFEEQKVLGIQKRSKCFFRLSKLSKKTI